MKKVVFVCSVLLGLSVLTLGAPESGTAASTKAQLRVQVGQCETAVKGQDTVTKADLSACKAAHLQVKVLCKSVSGATIVKINKVGYALRIGHRPVRVTSCLMPNITGQRLDLAESKLQRAGFDPTKLKIVGGGVFGVLVKSDWQVCNQTPGPGEVVSSVPRLKVDRTCEAEQQTTPAPTTSPTPSQPSTPTTVADQLDASAIEKAFLAQLAENGLNSIKAMCDPAYTRWSCFYEGVSNYGGYLRVSLVTDGGWSAADLDTMADQAGKAWFNFIGCEFPNLQIIVVTINGIDHNVSRSGTEADVLC